MFDENKYKRAFALKPDIFNVHFQIFKYNNMWKGTDRDYKIKLCCNFKYLLIGKI